jgi:hypothetical protein
MVVASVNIYLITEPNDRVKELHGRAELFQLTAFGVISYPAGAPDEITMIYPWHRIQRVELDPDARRALLP